MLYKKLIFIIIAVIFFNFFASDTILQMKGSDLLLQTSCGPGVGFPFIYRESSVDGGSGAHILCIVSNNISLLALILNFLFWGLIAIISIQIIEVIIKQFGWLRLGYIIIISTLLLLLLTLSGY
jgi:hypothetical protein